MQCAILLQYFCCSGVKIVLQGERDYRALKGPTGPLVYPAGFLYVYTALHWLSKGGHILPAQIIFAVLYLLTQASPRAVPLNCPCQPIEVLMQKLPYDHFFHKPAVQNAQPVNLPLGGLKQKLKQMLIVSARVVHTWPFSKPCTWAQRSISRACTAQPDSNTALRAAICSEPRICWNMSRSFA